MLIHLRRQSVALAEAIEATKAEMEAAVAAEDNNNVKTMEENKKILSELQVGNNFHVSLAFYTNHTVHC